jgi:hypothetical protein
MIGTIPSSPAVKFRFEAPMPVLVDFKNLLRLCGEEKINSSPEVSFPSALEARRSHEHPTGLPHLSTVRLQVFSTS